jgi:ABC transporter substrate binding protein
MPSMKRREFLLALGGAVTAWPLVTHAERRGKPARIGYLSASSPPDSNFESFLAGMRALGYGEGRDFVIEVRYAGRDYTRFPALLDALRHRLPSIFGWKMYVEAGGLMSYGPVQHDAFVRLAVYVDKILKGAKPADLPVEQPTKLEMVVNLKTAKALGLEIPPGLILRADELIE